MTPRSFAVSHPADGVVVIRIATEAEPYLGPEWVDGFSTILATLAEDTTVRAIILEGSAQYFSAGASRESLATATGDAAFPSYAARAARALLDTPLPIIAAAEGHAIGGGLLVALWCDVAVLAEESLYGANFMQLGFTPGMGATHVMREAFGEPLGRELLLTGRMLTGREISQACCPLSYAVVPRSRVMERARFIAHEIADVPREAVVLLARGLADRRRAVLEDALRQEEAAHARLFADPAAAAEILRRYPARSESAGSDAP